MKHILTTKELGEDLLEKQRERQENPEKWRGLPFGHADLDSDTGGARRGEVIVVAGAQKIGKTTFAKNFAVSFAKSLRSADLEEYVLYISLEMSHEGLAGRVFANEANIDATKFRDYALDESEFERLEQAVDQSSDLPALWDTGTYSYKDLQRVVNELEGNKEKPLRAIIVDYFQLFSSEGIRTGRRRHEQLAALSREFKQLSRSLNCTVVLLSQQSRKALTSFKRRKDPNTLAETQALVRDCDMLIIILEKYDEDKEEIPHMRELYLGLSRNSPADRTYDTVFVGKYARTGAPLGEEGDLEDLEETPDTRDEMRRWWDENDY